MKKIVKNTQSSVESAKSTNKQWLARMTKKRWVAVMALSLCFVFCMSFGWLQVAHKQDASTPQGQEQVMNQGVSAVDSLNQGVQSATEKMDLQTSDLQRDSGNKMSKQINLDMYVSYTGTSHVWGTVSIKVELWFAWESSLFGHDGILSSDLHTNLSVSGDYGTVTIGKVDGTPNTVQTLYVGVDHPFAGHIDGKIVLYPNQTGPTNPGITSPDDYRTLETTWVKGSKSGRTLSEWYCQNNGQPVERKFASDPTGSLFYNTIKLD
ncbi:MAG: hypothetical protein FWD76_01165 [Firmicutes bacterium]|nr:hypothetical protein [Bacillota bacterium]